MGAIVGSAPKALKAEKPPKAAPNRANDRADTLRIIAPDIGLPPVFCFASTKAHEPQPIPRIFLVVE